MDNRYTASEIAELLARADGLRGEDHADIHRRVRFFGSRELLENGRSIDRRDTKNYPKLEVYRARLLDTLSDFGVGSVELGTVVDAGDERQFQSTYAPSQKVGSVYQPLGGFRDSIRGIAAGENWELLLATFPPLLADIPGFHSGKFLKIRFQWADAPIEDRDLSRFGTQPFAVLTVDLGALFRPLLDLVGEPE